MKWPQRRNQKKTNHRGARTALSEAVRALARREHSTEELRTRLLRKGYTPDDIEAAIARCIDDGWLSDQRFAETIVRYRQSMGKGPRRIAYELREKGVDEAIIQSVLDSERQDWETSCLRVYQRKFGNQPPPDGAARAKIFRFLVSRGFTVEQINLTLSKVENEYHE